MQFVQYIILFLIGTAFGFLLFGLSALSNADREEKELADLRKSNRTLMQENELLRMMGVNDGTTD